jgi:hypothetical protein
MSDPGNTTAPSFTSLLLHNDGRVSMGSFLPAYYQLQIDNDGGLWTGNFVVPPTSAIGLRNNAVIGWRPNASQQRFGIGQNDDGLWIFQATGEPGQATSAAQPLGVSNNGIAFASQFRTGLAAGGVNAVCSNASLVLSLCSSSLRYKADAQPFTSGLSLVNRLRPITFTWKATEQRDLGFAAEDVAAVEPLLATYNAEGQIEGVKYGHLTAVLVNAIKEQQAQIDKVAGENAQLTRDNAQLKERLEAVYVRLASLEARIRGGVMQQSDAPK